MDNCEKSDNGKHLWSCPGPVVLPTAQGSVSILMPLFCQYCLDTKTLYADKPEETVKQQLRNSAKNTSIPFPKL